ncbi:hypothetical protein Fcan01_23249 [Folsomia candida]|uniref:Uncharacterized protein n=1 Tax=Folsomia candida TaxID=158441 RepID=A0A226D9C1_FOLCA|nr:hypothetical protein Fcan01_23249 [Folsomia candida]
MPNTHALHIYRKVFLFYFKFPCSYSPSTRRFYAKTGKDLFFSFCIPEFAALGGIVLNTTEAIYTIYSERIKILSVLLLLIGLIQCVYNVTAAVAFWLVKYEQAAFLNDLVRQVEKLEEGFEKRAQKWDTLTVMLFQFIVISATLPFLFAMFVAFLTVHDKYYHIKYAVINSVCPMNTYFSCKLVTFIVLTITYSYVGFHCAAILVGSIVTSAVVLNMLLDSVRDLSRLNPRLGSIRMYQRFRIIFKTMENTTTFLATLMLSIGFGFTVMCNFTTVRMLGVIRMPFYLFFPTAALVAMAAIGILLPYGIASWERSGKLLAGWRVRLRVKWGIFMRRYCEQTVKGLRPIGLRAGMGEFNFFVFKKSTKSSYYVAVMDKTIEALMT